MRFERWGAALAWFAAAAVWLAAPAPSDALTLNPGQALEAPFTLSGPATGADTLTFHLVGVSAVGVATMTVELWDGATLLASVSGVPVNGIAGFVDAGSNWETNQVGADLASVRAGTIIGRVRVLPAFVGVSTLTADVSAITSFAVGHGSAVATIVPIDGVLVAGSPFLVPEPGAAMLLFAAASWWGSRVLRR